MASSPASEVILSDKDYRQIATDMFQGYADEDFEGKLLWKAMKIDIKNWTKENWDRLSRFQPPNSLYFRFFYTQVIAYLQGYLTLELD